MLEAETIAKQTNPEQLRREMVELENTLEAGAGTSLKPRSDRFRFASISQLNQRTLSSIKFKTTQKATRSES
jgi:hypothetical protein